MKQIEKYIQFAKKNLIKSYSFDIDINISEIRWNGYEYEVVYKTEDIEDKIALNSMIMKKPFIEAIARGLKEKGGYEKVLGLWIICNDETFNDFIDDLTYKQAIAIRDNSLSQFITNLGI